MTLLFVFGMLFLSVIFSPLAGAAVGWLLSVIMPGLLIHGFHAVGLSVTAADLPAIGAMLGFVGAFFKSSCPSSK